MENERKYNVENTFSSWKYIQFSFCNLKYDFYFLLRYGMKVNKHFLWAAQ